MVIAETLVGIQLVKASVSGIKEVINTCQDISELSHHIDNVFSGQEHVDKKIAAKKKPQGKWNKFIGSRLRTDDEGDGTSIQEIAAEIIEKKTIHLLNTSFTSITSIQEIAAEIIEKKTIAKEMRSMSLLLNSRFGADTWSTIMKTRMERLKEREEKLKVHTTVRSAAKGGR